MVDLVVGDDERGRHHHGVGDRAGAGRVHPQVSFEGSHHDGVAIDGELEAVEHASASDVDDGRMAGELMPKPGTQHLTLHPSPLDQLLSLEDVEHGQCSRARGVAAGEGEVHEPAVAEHFGHLFRGGHRADGHVAPTQPLAAHDHIGLEREVLMTPCEAGAAVAGHHLVGDEQDVVLPARLGDHAPVLVARRQACPCGTGDRFGDEAGDGARVFLLDHLQHHLGIVPRHLGERQQQRLVAGLTGGVAAGGHGGERHPVIAGMPADHLPAIGATLAHLVRARQPQGRVGALAPAAGEEHVGEPGGQPAFDQPVAQREPRRGGPQRHDVPAAGHRLARGIGHLGPTPADVADDRAGGAVEDAAAVGGVEPAAVGADDGGVRGPARYEGVAAAVSGRFHPVESRAT